MECDLYKKPWTRIQEGAAVSRFMVENNIIYSEYISEISNVLACMAGTNGEGGGDP